MSTTKNNPENGVECPTHRSNEDVAIDVPFASSTTPEDDAEAESRKFTSSNQTRRKYIKVIALIVIIAVLAAGVSVGVYCGQGNCSSDQETKPFPDVEDPTPDPVSIPSPTPDPVPIPSPTPETTFSAALTDYINNITLSGRTISTRGVTPEDEALKFMIANETATADDLLTNGAVRFRMRQRFALLSLWFQQSINGVFTPSWT